MAIDLLQFALLQGDHQLYERFLDSYRFDDAAPGSVASPLAGEAAA